MTKKILLVDDHPLMRKGTEQLLRLSPLFTEIIETDNGEEALSLAATHQPDLVILDLQMKGLSGLDTLVALKAQNKERLVAIFTVSDSKEDHDRLMRAGADAFFLKDLDPEFLLEKISDLVIHNISYSALNDNDESNKEDPLSVLTKRELQILHLVSKGARNRQIADQMYISEATVKVHLKNILKKLNVDSRLSASLIYLEK